MRVVLYTGTRWVGPRLDGGMLDEPPVWPEYLTVDEKGV